MIGPNLCYIRESSCENLVNPLLVICRIRFTDLIMCHSVMNMVAVLLWTSLVAMTFGASQQSVVFKPEMFTDLGAGCGRAQQCGK